MTEAEIMKALECCPQCNHEECPFEPMEQDKGTIGCCDELLKAVFDLINRKNPQADRFAYYFENAVYAKLKPARAEAIKEISGEIQTEIEKAMRIAFTALQGRREKLLSAGATEKDLVNDDIICWLEGHISAFKSMGYFVELLANKKGVEL